MPRPQWRRNQIAVTFAACLIFAGFTLVLPFIPYYVEEVGVRGRAVNIWSGALLSIAPFLAALMAPVWGRLADRFGMKIMAQRTMLTMVVHWVLMAFATTITHLLALRIFLGLFSGFATMSVALVTQGAPREKTGSIVGTLQSLQILAAAAGPFLGGILYEAVGIRPTCLVTALFCLAGFALITFTYDERGLREADHAAGQAAPLRGGEGRPAAAVPPRMLEGRRAAASSRPSLKELFGLPGIAPLAAVLFFATVISRSFGLVTPLFVRQLAPGAAGVGLLAGIAVSAGSFAEAVSAMIQGRAAGRWAPQLLIFVGLALASAAILPMIVVTAIAPFIMLRTLQGLLAGGTLTLGYTIGGGVFPDRARATGYGMLSSAAMLGGAAGPTLAGLISYGFGLRWVFVASGIGYAALALVALNGIQRRLRVPARPPGAPPPPPYIPVPR